MNRKMKPPIVVASLKFRRYPQKKPEKAGYYWVLIRHNGLVRVEYELWQGGHWLNALIVIAFAEPPTVDLDSEEFDFATARELWKINRMHHYVCQSVVTGRKWKFTSGKMCRERNHTEEWDWIPDRISFEEIDGRWRLAE